MKRRNRSGHPRKWLNASIAALLIAGASYDVVSGLASAETAVERGPDAVAHRQGGRPVPGDGRLPHAVVSRTGFEAGEPTLGVTGDGSVFFTAMRDNLRVDVVRSDDRGRSWKVVSPSLGGQNAHLLSLDPYLWVDPATDRVFTVDLTVACSFLSFSDDSGESWTTNPLACGRPVNDHQTLFGGPPAMSAPQGYPRVLYYCFNDVGSSSCSKSVDGGISFVPTGAPAFTGVDPSAGGELCGGLHGHGVVTSDGIVLLPREYCARPFLAISRDEGGTWTRAQVAGNGARPTDPSVDVDRQGNIYYAWVAKNGLPYLSVSEDGGKGWTEPMMIGAPGVKETNLLTLDVGRPGSVAFAYMGTADSRHPKVWNGYMGITTGALDRDPLFYSATVNDKKDPLKRGTCGPGRCGEEILDFIDVVIATDGTGWASFVDACDTRCARSGLEGGNEGIVGHFVGGPELR